MEALRTLNVYFQPNEWYENAWEFDTRFLRAGLTAETAEVVLLKYIYRWIKVVVMQSADRWYCDSHSVCGGCFKRIYFLY